MGWARAGGVVGAVTTGLTLALGLASAANNCAGIVFCTRGNLSLALGATGTLIFLAGLPITYAGAVSSSGKTRESVALRVSGWVGYSIAAIIAITAIGIDLTPGRDVESGVIYAVTAIGASSALLMTIDAFRVDRAARSRRGALATAVSRGTPVRPRLFVAPVRSLQRVTGATLGLLLPIH